MTRIGELRYEIAERMIELAALESRSVLEEMEDMVSSFKFVMDETPLDERDPTVKWTP